MQGRSVFLKVLRVLLVWSWPRCCVCEGGTSLPGEDIGVLAAIAAGARHFLRRGVRITGRQHRDKTQPTFSGSTLPVQIGIILHGASAPGRRMW